MKANKNIPTTVDQYIAGFPPGTQKLLAQLRATVKKAAPEAQEGISYQMPSYKYNGVLLNFAAYKTHIGFYPRPSGIEEFQDELSKYPISKGTVQFPLDKPLPLGLISRIVKYRVKENKEGLELRPKRKVSG
jgi:uncharacterized protein YdhG (YjbR/CyaY superfamily)